MLSSPFPAHELARLKNDCHPEEKTPSASVESIPEVLEECTSATEHSDATSVHDMDYVNPRGVRFTQCSQKEGEDADWCAVFSKESRGVGGVGGSTLTVTASLQGKWAETDWPWVPPWAS